MGTLTSQKSQKFKQVQDISSRMSFYREKVKFFFKSCLCIRKRPDNQVKRAMQIYLNEMEAEILYGTTKGNTPSSFWPERCVDIVYSSQRIKSAKYFKSLRNNVYDIIRSGLLLSQCCWKVSKALQNISMLTVLQRVFQKGGSREQSFLLLCEIPAIVWMNSSDSFWAQAYLLKTARRCP